MLVSCERNGKRGRAQHGGASWGRPSDAVRPRVIPSSGLPRRRLTLVYGLLLAVALAQVPLVAYLLSARGASPTAPLAPGGRLIARGPASNPRLIVTPNGLIGWWLTGTGAGQRLTVALFGRGRVARRRTIALSTLAGADGVVQDTPALALGPGRQLLLTWRSVNPRAHVAALGIGTWNALLTGRPTLKLVSVVPLITTAPADDPGPHEQYLSYEPANHDYLLVEERLRPWAFPSSTTPNRPQILVSSIGADGRLAATTTIDLPAAGSFIDPTVRVLASGGGYQLIVTTPSVGPDSQAGPDQLWLYRLDRAGARLGAAVELYSSPRLDQIFDSTAASGADGAQLLVFELADPEQSGGQLKQLIGLPFDGNGPLRAPFVISRAVDPGAQLSAQPALYATGRPGRFLLAWNEGTAGVFTTVSLTGGPVRLRRLFGVAHRLYLQPPAGVTYDPASGTLAALWQDPGRARTPQDIPAEAPLYLSAAMVN